MVDSSVQFRNIAGVYAYKEDGNLTPEATASAPRARHLAKSAAVRKPPPAIREILSLTPRSVRTLKARGNAAKMGMPTFSLT